VAAVTRSEEGPAGPRLDVAAAAGADDPDREVLARVAAGEVEAVSTIVERHQDRLRSVCPRLLGDREAARDAVQEVFLKAYRKAGSFRPRGKVSTWLYRIAVNHCLNRLRRRKLVRFLSFGETGPAGQDREAAFDPADEAPDAATRAEARERWQRTRELIDQLPAGQRAVLVLAKFEGLSYRQIAETLEITEGAVESRLFRAVQRLVKAQETQSRGVPCTERT
jgi:RNA polymerase sigma-70 factor (ECF subfamily)